MVLKYQAEDVPTLVPPFSASTRLMKMTTLGRGRWSFDKVLHQDPYDRRILQVENLHAMTLVNIPDRRLRPGRDRRSGHRCSGQRLCIWIDGKEFGNRQSDLVVIERRQDVKSADDGEHLINA